ncbi:hypothetical protein QJQ45_014231, partial [Haematococcus lacustris]
LLEASFNIRSLALLKLHVTSGAASFAVDSSMAFPYVSLPSTSAFNEPFTKSLLEKWDMRKSSRVCVFRYTKYYHRLAGQELLLDLFNDPSSQEHLQVMLRDSSWRNLSGEKVLEVEAARVPCSATRMDLFDKVTEPDQGAEPLLVRGPGGELVKRMDDVRDGFQASWLGGPKTGEGGGEGEGRCTCMQIQDNLREMLLCEESENAELYSAAEKDEFLWRLFEHLSLGGPCCQYEDKIAPYLDTTKELYKELVTVCFSSHLGCDVTKFDFRCHRWVVVCSTACMPCARRVQRKSGDSDAIEIVSTVFSIKSFKTESGTLALFPRPSRNSFCYVTIDPMRRLVKMWYHAHLPFW